MMVTPGGSVRKRSENWPVRGAVGGNPEAFTYEELFRGLEVIKVRHGASRCRSRGLRPCNQDTSFRLGGCNDSYCASRRALETFVRQSV